MTKQISKAKTVTTIDFKVDPKTGVGYISRAKLAELLGVSHTAINHHIRSFHPKLESNQPLTDEIFAQVSGYYSFDAGRYCTKEAKLVAKALLQAGARAFIYYHAGVQLPSSTSNNKLHDPCVPVRWLAQQLGRSRSSVDRTINVSIRRLRDYAVSQEVNYVNGERCVSPALVLCCMFTGTKMQAARGWLLTLAETDTLPAPEVLLQLTSPIN